MLTPLPLPVALPIWGLADFKITRPELRMMIGDPHFIETDFMRTSGGEEDSWAFSLPSGQRMLMLLRVPYEVATRYGDPPELMPIVGELGLSPDDSRLYPYTEPYQQE
jgi:hypothetical protein